MVFTYVYPTALDYPQEYARKDWTTHKLYGRFLDYPQDRLCQF